MNLKPWRPIFLWSAIAVSALLGVFSIRGSFFKAAEDAQKFYNSPVLVMFWFLLAVVLVAGTAMSPNILRRPGSLAMHVGPILILVGSMLGSETGQTLIQKLFNTKQLHSTGTMYLAVPQGGGNNAVTTDKNELVGELPFTVRLHRFTIEYYPPRDANWLMYAETFAPEEAPGSEQHRPELIAWAVGQELPIPHTNAFLKVLQYIPSARRTYPEGVEGTLEIMIRDGNSVAVPVATGTEIPFGNPPTVLRVAKIFTRARVVTGEPGKSFTLMEDTAGPLNPAAEVLITKPDGTKQTRYAFSQGGMGRNATDMVDFRFLPAEPSGAVADPSTDSPAIRVGVRRAGGPWEEGWLAPNKGEDQVGFALRERLGPPADPRDGEANIWLVRPEGMEKSFKSDVDVIEGGETVISHQIIEVNHPLHYGGYNLYQASYRMEGQVATILSVANDRGLWCVYAGFFLLCGGAAWHFWVVPVAGYVARRGDGN